MCYNISTNTKKPADVFLFFFIGLVIIAPLSRGGWFEEKKKQKWDGSLEAVSVKLGRDKKDKEKKIFKKIHSPSPPLYLLGVGEKKKNETDSVKITHIIHLSNIGS